MKRAPKNAGSTPVIDPDSFFAEIHRTVTSNKLIADGDIVIVGVSGGPDSTALAHILYELRYILGLKIIVAHFNHRMRPQAIRDEQFVARMAKDLGLTYVCARAKERPPKTGSLEDWARRQRFDFLVRTAVKYKADAVALAHTADDLAETVLMRILRGSGLMGLKGMSEASVMHGIKFIRPFLSVAKVRLLEYLREHRLGYCKDQTNKTTDFFRNKIRLKLLPLLNKEYNANVRNVLVHLSRSVADDYDLLFREASALWPGVCKITSGNRTSVVLDAGKLRKVHPALMRIIVRMAYEKLKGDMNQLTFGHVQSVEKLLLKSSGAADLPGQVFVKKEEKRLYFYRGKSIRV